MQEGQIHSLLQEGQLSSPSLGHWCSWFSSLRIQVEIHHQLSRSQIFRLRAHYTTCFPRLDLYLADSRFWDSSDSITVGTNLIINLNLSLSLSVSLSLSLSLSLHTHPIASLKNADWYIHGREKHQLVASHSCGDRDQTSDFSLCRMTLNQLSHSGQG